MNKPGNQLHMETEKKLREALLKRMESGQEPTVGGLCAQAGINRSTFYRHYVDIYDLMSHIEMEFQHGLYQSMSGGGAFLAAFGSDPAALETMITYIGRNASFYRVYLRKYAGVDAEKGFAHYWKEQVKPLFRSYGVEQERHMRYYFDYVQTGLITVLKSWLDNGCEENPKEMADILCRMIPTRP